MENVVKNAKEIAGESKITLYLKESEVRRLDWEEAVQEGYDIGAQEKQTEMILNMYKKNYTIDMIADIANLSIDEIKKIINVNK